MGIFWCSQRTDVNNYQSLDITVKHLYLAAMSMEYPKHIGTGTIDLSILFFKGLTVKNYIN